MRQVIAVTYKREAGASVGLDKKPSIFRPRNTDETLLRQPADQWLGESWPQDGRLAGIDYGTVRIGLSICDPSRTWISPLTTYNRRTEKLDSKFFSDLVKQEGIRGWVLGLPLHCDGHESQKSNEAREFAIWLHQLTGLPIRFFDERYTTKLASRLLVDGEFTKKQLKKRIDRVAAHLILEHFIEYDRAVRERTLETSADPFPPTDPTQ